MVMRGMQAMTIYKYECSFDAAVPGAYYAKQISEIYGLGRVGDFKPQTVVFAVPEPNGRYVFCVPNGYQVTCG